MQTIPQLNFSAGPGALPPEVLEETREALLQAPGTRQSLLGIHHRSDWFRNLLQESEEHLRALLQLPDHYRILQLQGGSSLQFSMVPILFLRGRQAGADYLRTGYWSNKSLPDARREGEIRIAWDGSATHYSSLPEAGELSLDPNARYFHYVSNETVEGLQFHTVPGLEHVPRVCDMSSDFLSRPIPVEQFSLIYAHAQKNLGPSGLTLVLLQESLLEEAPDHIHSMLDYKNHAMANSIYNTPPIFSIYVTMLVLKWLRFTVGGVEKMAAINEQKAKELYRVLDASPHFYRGHASRAHRSRMNVVFNLPTQELEKKFVEEALEKGFYGLEGHRSLGGIRVSLYNGVTQEDVSHLLQFMEDFHRKNR